MEIYIGTSGWKYFWNEGNSLEWYVKNTGLNAVELNASFYRFPFSNMIKSWKKKGGSLKWCVKVSKQITHIHKFDEDTIEIFKNFRELFKPMEDIISFYLFQLPPKMKPDRLNKIEDFLNATNISEKIAFEFRNEEWFKEEVYEWAKYKKITFVSVDAPKLPQDIINTSGTVYLRFHGREDWYEHNYTDKELEKIKDGIKRKSPEKVFLFFNNDVHMFNNALLMKKIFFSFYP